MTITLTVAGRIATVEADGHVVAGNTYPVTVALDSEWTGSLYLRVRFGSLYYDIPFASSAASVDVQMPVGYPEVGIGVFSEALEICTNEARVRLLRSILEAGEQVVEFDSDLYDQWAGEVSELLCDDAFDSTSDRPVKNSVLTAWKDTVPLDANLVHKTGAETIAGDKTLTGKPTVKASAEAYLDLATNKGYQAEGYKSEIRFYDQKDGASNVLNRRVVGTATGGQYSYATSILYNYARDNSYVVEQRAFSDHAMLVMPTYYPVDGSGNPQALPVNAFETSGNIGVDPRLVHTSGVETIAGGKTFTATMNIKGTAQLVPRTVYDAGTPSTYYGWKGRITIIDHKDGAESTVGDILCTSTQTYGEVSMRAYKPDRSAFSELRLRDYADFQSLLIPSHYPTSNGNPVAPAEGEAMSSGMIAVDPRIVHTIGNETVAGVKTLTNGINAYPQGWHGTSKTMSQGQYCVFARINPANLGPGHFHILDFVQSSNTSCCYGRMMFKADRTAPLPMWMFKKNVGSNNPLDTGSIVVLTDASTVYLAWKKVAPYGTVMAREVLDINYGGPMALGGASNVQFYAQADMTVLDSLDGYTVYEVTE